MKNTVVVDLRHISKQYIINREKPTLIEKIVKQSNGKFFALHNISLTIQSGERVGILGRNGSGKTTLLKIIAGITTPTEGVVRTRGSIVSLIDISAGFHAELTGIQNIFLNGMILGIPKSLIEKNLAKIIAYADIGRFMNAPMYTYSQGMRLRLGFSIIVNSDSDIFILDDGLGVGDKDFQKKSIASIRNLMNHGKTIIIANHWLSFIEDTCSRIIIMEKGNIVADGTKKLIYQYKHNHVAK